MKKLLALLLLLACIQPSWAALTISNCNTGNGSTNPLTVALTGSVGSGQAVVVFIYNFGTDSNVVSDGTNGTYTKAYSAALGGSEGWWWVKTTGSSTPTVSITNPSANYLEVSACSVTGFTGTPTIDASLESNFTGSTATVSASPLTTGFNTEAMLFGIAAPVSGTGWATAPANWTDELGAGNTTILGAIEATSGTTNNVSGTLSTSQSWYALSFGLYDATGASTPHAPLFVIQPAN